MTAPDPYTRPISAETSNPALVRAAIWVAIGALIAAASVCVVWVLIGTQNGIIGRAFLTILLLAAFAGVSILDAHLAPRRPSWFALASMAAWVATLLIGAVMIWLPERGFWGGYRLIPFLVIVLILQLALLHVRLYVKAYQRYTTAFTRTVFIITIALVIVLAVLLVLPLMLNEYIDFAEFYWRVVVAVTILAALGTALLPLINVLFAPKKPRPEHQGTPQFGQAQHFSQAQQPALAPQGALAPQAWPTYADGFTPLPVLPDGTPDWNAYYTGYPTNVAHFSPQQAAPSAPTPPPAAGYDGFPPPPPLPPRP